jgi:hypothetical protein
MTAKSGSHIALARPLKRNTIKEDLAAVFRGHYSTSKNTSKKNTLNAKTGFILL